ncbi:uncharacterized protein METZ01_LOCUS454165, partial [marine metagenome]
ICLGHVSGSIGHAQGRARGSVNLRGGGRGAGLFIGPSARVPGFVMAGGCNAHGVSGSAGIGRHVVESMFDDAPSEYVRSLSPDRFSENGWDWPTARRDAQHYYETYYCLGH